MNADIFVIAVVMAMACEWETRTGKGSATRRYALEDKLSAFCGWPVHSPHNWMPRNEAIRAFRAAMFHAGAFDVPWTR